MNIINANLHAILLKLYAQSELQHLIKAALLGEEDLGSLSDGDFDLPCKKKAWMFLGRMLYVVTKRLLLRPEAQVSVHPAAVSELHVICVWIVLTAIKLAACE